MTRLLDLLGTHWFALVLLLVAAGLGGYAALRKRTWPWYVGTALTAFALGALFLHGWKYQIADDGPVRSLAVAVLYGGLTLLIGAAAVLVIFRGWSFWFAAVAGCVIAAAVGGLGGRWLGSGIAEVGKSVAWIRFVSPWWLTLLLFLPAVYLVSRSSLSGLGPVRRWVAIAARMLVVACLVLAMAEPRVRRPSENVAVIFVVDRSASVPAEFERTPSGDLLDLRWSRIRGLVESSVTSRYAVNRDDQFGVILFGKRPKLGYPPAPVVKVPIDESAAGSLDPNYTDVGAALKLAMASFPEGTGKRIVLISDGNENLGAAEEQAELARKNGIPIDTIALAPSYRNESEVLVQAVEAPPTAAQGARLPIRVLVRNAHPSRVVDGSLELLRVGGGEAADDRPLDKQTVIDIEDGPQVLDATRKPPRVRLLPGLNVFRFQDRDQSRGETSYTYKAAFSPEVKIDGDRVANNRADAAVVARGQRRVLFLDQADREAASSHQYLLQQLKKARIQYVFRRADDLPNDKTELGVYLSNFDCVVLANVPADKFNTDQMEVIRTQVHDQGCGLVMVGGPDSFGPGGYQQTPIEMALPVDCEIKAKKAMGRGGLILIMHASEMADGNKWQKIIAKLALQRLSAADMIGVCDFGGLIGNTVNWQIPFQVIEDQKDWMFGQIDRMNPGDMPDFDPFIQAAADTLADPKHNLAVKHCIIISDGDPNFSNNAALQKMTDNGITCTTIGVATHGVNEDAKMKRIAESTKDANGKTGSFYKVTDPSKLPAIYIKESRKISQSFIYDKPFDPALQIVGGPTEGIGRPLPKMYGFVRTTNKQSPTQQMQVEGPPDAQGEQQFPVVASWRYGLGKSAAYTSDARNDNKAWGRDWAASPIYQKFWENTINWAMREAERGKLTMVTEYRDGKVRVTLDARDEKDKAVIGLALKGRVTAPNKPQPGDKVPTVEFKPTGAGQYVAEFDAQEAGAYFVNVQAETEQIGPDGKPVIDPATKLPKMVPFDAARAGVTVPYSPEYADLESNTALLQRIASTTGGNYHEEPADPVEMAKQAEFFRKGPETIRAVLPFWFWLLFAAGLILLFDVGVRRISVEPKEVRTAAAKAWGWARRKPVATDEEEGGMLGALGQRKRQTADVLAKKRAARKFEAGEGADEPAPAGADDYAAKSDKPGALPPPPPPRSAQPDDDAGDDFMTRMRKAKERGKKKQDGE